MLHQKHFPPDFLPNLVTCQFPPTSSSLSYNSWAGWKIREAKHKHKLLLMSQCSVTHAKDSAICPLPHPWDHRCLQLTSVTMIDSGERVTPFQHNTMSNVANLAGEIQIYNFSTAPKACFMCPGKMIGYSSVSLHLAWVCVACVCVYFYSGRIGFPGLQVCPSLTSTPCWNSFYLQFIVHLHLQLCRQVNPDRNIPLALLHPTADRMFSLEQNTTFSYNFSLLDIKKFSLLTLIYCCQNFTLLSTRTTHIMSLLCPGP